MVARIEAFQVSELNTVTSLPVAVPAGVRAGEVLVNFLGVSGGTSAPPAGWKRAALNEGTAAVSYFDWHPVTVAGLEPASYTWGGFASGRATGIMLRISGADLGNPIDVAASIGTNTGTGNTCVCGTQTTQTPGTLTLSGICGNAAVGLTWTPPAGWGLVATSTGTGRGSAVASATGPAQPGSTGAQTWSWSTTNLELRGLMISIRDALVYENRPYNAFQLAFSDPNISPDLVPPIWVDFTRYLRSASGMFRGRQYELGQTFPLAPVATLRDLDENLNSENPSSPYFPNVKPYRGVLWQAMWPNLGLGNLINTGAWRGNKADVFDPTFESFATGSTPSWVSRIGNATTVVSTTTAFQGTKSLRSTLASSSTLAQGSLWPIACIPGQTYTASAYVKNQAVGNTLTLGIGRQVGASDAFNRTVTSSWGSADFTGGAYTTSGGSASDYNVRPGAATHTLTSVNVSRICYLPSINASDMMLSTVIAVDQLAVGNAITAGLLGRLNPGSNNWYQVALQFNTDATLTLVITKRLAGVDTTLNSVVLPWSYTPGAQFALELDATGGTITATCWPIALGATTAQTLTASDASIAAGTLGDGGVRSFLSVGNTNTNPNVIFSSLGCQYTQYGTSTAAVGSFVRLTCTFTATQALHSMQFMTVGSVSADSAFADAIQLELGVNASAFTASGPVIYPVFRGFAERFTKQWQDGGFTGYVQLPLVDAFAALNASRISTEYPTAVLKLDPDYYWPLSGGVSSLSFPDATGTGKPPLTAVVSKYGPGTPPSPGSFINVPGDPGGSGVAFTPSDPADISFSQQVTILGTGLGGAYGSPLKAPLPFNTTPFVNYTATAACWFQSSTTTVPTGGGTRIMEWYTPGYDSEPMTLIHSSVAGLTGACTGNNGAIFANSGASKTYFDMKPHLAVVTVSVVGGTGTVTLYVDGAQVAQNTGTPGTFQPNTSVQIGGIVQPPNIGQSGFSAGPIFPGTVSDVAAWARLLSSAEIASLWQAGGLAFTGETTGARLLRHLANSGFALTQGPFGNVRISTGETTLGPPTFTTAIDMLTDATNLATAELGVLWVAPDGALVFEDRNDRYLRLTSSMTLGESQAGGETPYEEGIQTDIDPTFAYADVEVTRNNGVTALGGQSADINKAVAGFFNRAFTANGDFQFDAQAQDYADWVFYTHNGATQRISELELNPAALTDATLATAHSVPVAWPVAFNLEISKRITVKQRMPAANGGAGLTLSADFFVESVEHDQIDMDTGAWVTLVTLSPLNLGKAQSMQPWILEDATYGVLDSTTKLGF